MTTTARTIDDANALLLFKVGPVYCCSPTLPVVSVQMPPRLSHPPGTSEAQPGVFKYSTGIVRVVDLRQRFGVDDEDRQHPGRIVVAEVTGGLAGFWVDEIIDVIHFPDQGWGEVPALVPRTVFSRTLLFNKQIQLYAEFEALNAFRETGYLRQHIQVLKSQQQQPDDQAAEQPTGERQDRAAELSKTDTLSMDAGSADNKQPAAGETGVQRDAKQLTGRSTEPKSTMHPVAPSANSPAAPPRPPSERGPSPTPTTTPTPAPTPKPTTGGMSSPGSPPVAGSSGAPGRPGPHSPHPDKPRQAEPAEPRVSQDFRRTANRTADSRTADNRAPDNRPPDNSGAASPHDSGRSVPQVPPAADDRARVQSSVAPPSAVTSARLNSSGEASSEELPYGSRSSSSRSSGAAPSSEISASEISASEISSSETASGPASAPAVSSGSRDYVAWFLVAVLLVVILLGGYFIGDMVTAPDDRPVALEPAVDLGSRPQYASPQVEELRPPESQADAGASATIETAPLPGRDGDSNAGELNPKLRGGIASNIDTSDRPDKPEPPGSSDETGRQAQSAVSRPGSGDSYWRSEPAGSAGVTVSQVEQPSTQSLSPQQLDAAVSPADAPSYHASIDRDEQGLVITINAPDDELLMNLGTQLEPESLESELTGMDSIDAASIETGTEEAGSSDGTIELDRQDLAHAARQLQSSPIAGAAQLPASVDTDSGVQQQKKTEPAMDDKTMGEKTMDQKTMDQKTSGLKTAGQKNTGDQSTKQKTANKKTTRQKSTRTTIIHIVVRGDTLWHIAKRYINNPYRYPELARLSKIKNPDLIYPGDRVKIILNRTAPASRRQ